jgi:hypothetical protein
MQRVEGRLSVAAVTRNDDDKSEALSVIPPELVLHAAARSAPSAHCVTIYRDSNTSSNTAIQSGRGPSHFSEVLELVLPSTSRSSKAIQSGRGPSHFSEVLELVFPSTSRSSKTIQSGRGPSHFSEVLELVFPSTSWSSKVTVSFLHYCK